MKTTRLAFTTPYVIRIDADGFIPARNSGGQLDHTGFTTSPTLDGAIEQVVADCPGVTNIDTVCYLPNRLSRMQMAGDTKSSWY